MDHCAPNRVLLHSTNNHHYTYQQHPTPHILYPSSWAGEDHRSLPVAPNLRNRHAIRSEAMRHNLHKQLYTRRAQTPQTKNPSSTHEEPKLHKRRTQAPQTKKPFAPYRTNLFRKQIYAQKFGHKNHIRKPSVATRKGPGRLSSSNRGPSYKISIEHFR